jgi:DNA-directed RNA polymerase sigma subunit (sigma70/sigma32)
MSARSKEIFSMRYEGSTLNSIGKFFGLSRERIRQILAREERYIRKMNLLTEITCKT